MLPGHRLARGLASSGVDWVLADQEHGNISDDSMHEAVSTIASCGVSPLVRIPDGQIWMVKRALDAGAHGIMVPLLRSAKEAEELVRLAKFPPVGTRGYGSPFSMNAFATGTQRVPTQVEYLQQANSSLLTMVQIETKEALDDVEAIAAVPGIDVLFVGPFDLGNDIGHPILSAEMPAELKAAIERIRVAAATAGKYSGIYALNGAQARAYAAQGFHMANVMTDAAALPIFTSQMLADARGGQAEKATGPYGR